MEWRLTYAEPVRWAGLMLAVIAVPATAQPVPDLHPALPRAAPTGGWTRDGWSDDVQGSAMPPAVATRTVEVRATSPVAGERVQAGRPGDTGTVADATARKQATPAPSARPVTAPAGGWTRDGWSDDVRATAASLAPQGGMAMQPPAAPGYVPPGTPGRVWDGGRGPAFRYERGKRLFPLFTGPAYRVDDWIGYGLPSPPAGARWIRYFDDAVMIDERAGVIDAVPGVDWSKAPALYGPTPHALGRGEEDSRSTWSEGTTTTEVRSAPGGGKIMITTTTTPGGTSTAIHEQDER